MTLPRTRAAAALSLPEVHPKRITRPGAHTHAEDTEVGEGDDWTRFGAVNRRRCRRVAISEWALRHSLRNRESVAAARRGVGGDSGETGAVEVERE